MRTGSDITSTAPLTSEEIAELRLQCWHGPSGERCGPMLDRLLAAERDTARTERAGESATVSLSDPRTIIAGIRRFGLASDGSDLRDLERAIAAAIRAGGSHG